MGYIEEIRKVVGHRPLILTGVGIAVFNDKNEILLQKNFDGKWGIPGGFMELGESAEAAGRREVYEETGIHVGDLELVTVVSGEQTYTKLKNEDEYYSVTIVYSTTDIVGGLLKADGIETIDVQFFGADNLPNSLNPIMEKMIKQYYINRK